MALLSICVLGSVTINARSENQLEKDITQLLNWAVHLSRYPQPEALPTVKFVEHDFLELNACLGKKCNVLGWYNDQDIVYIDKRIGALDSLMARSIMVHELIHYLQDISGNYSDNCAQQVMREHEAYEIQRKYFYAYGALSPVRIHAMYCDEPVISAATGD